MDDVKIIETRILRGDILKVLHNIHGDNNVGAMTLDKLLELHGWNLQIPEIKEQCLYLKEKGYIEIKDLKAHGITEFTARITAKGRDLLEGSLGDDPGVTTHED